MPWRRERLPTPVFWPGEFHGLYPWGRKSQIQLSDFHFTSSALCVVLFCCFLPVLKKYILPAFNKVSLRDVYYPQFTDEETSGQTLDNSACVVPNQ